MRRNKRSKAELEVRRNDDGSIDEILFWPKGWRIAAFHMEMMSDSHLWIGLNDPSTDSTYHVNLAARGKLWVNCEGKEL